MNNCALDCTTMVAILCPNDTSLVKFKNMNTTSMTTCIFSEIKSHKDRCEELEAKIRALDEELNMLRNMSHEQEFLGDKVSTIN